MSTSPESKINLESITESFSISNVESFQLYLKEVWIDLSQRSFKKIKGINKLTFNSYFNLPGILGDRLFAVLDKSNCGYIELTDFITGMKNLFAGDFDTNSKFIFDFYDFDNDGFINSEDIRIVLSYITLSQDSFDKIDYHQRCNSQEELYQIVSQIFKTENSERIDYDKFKNVIENTNSDAYLIILLFLFEKKPFTKANLDSYTPMTNVKSPSTSVNSSPKKSSVKLVASPTKNYSFSPYDCFKRSNRRRKKTLTEEQSTLNRKLNLNLVEDEKEVDIRKRRKLFTYQQRGDDIISLKPIDADEVDDVLFERKKHFKLNSHIKTSNKETKVNHSDIKIQPAFKQNTITYQNIFSSNKSDTETTSTKSNNNIVNAFWSSHHNSNVVIKEENDEEHNDDIEDELNLSVDSDYEDSNDIITYEGYLYKLIDGKMKRLWFKLIHKDLYFFKNQSDTTHKGMHNLSGLFLKEEPAIEQNGIKYYGFSVVYPAKTRYYYVDSESDFNNWIEKLKKATGYTNLDDIYDVKEKLGSGKFGLVKLGINKKDGKKVAIKIMSKKEMKTEDLELVRSEIEILKICQHPNIIQLYDVFENIDYFYIIMEHCGGGDLDDYLKKRNFKLSESHVCTLVHKICAAVFYIHSYGIAHRDLKPENILMTDDTDDADIRIVDFGLSKIIGPEEKCTEPYGTLTYVAPEVLLEYPYTKAVDLWSVGVMTYLMLTSRLPFDDPNSEYEIARKVVEDCPSYSQKRWEGISNEAKNFVQRLLERNVNKRMTIKEALTHPWITKFCGKDMTEVRKMSSEMKGSCFEMYSSTSTVQKMF